MDAPRIPDRPTANRCCRRRIVIERRSDLEEHLVQSSWGKRDQQTSSLVTFVLERVQTTHWHVEKRSFAGNDSIFSELKRHLTFQNEKGFLLSAVDVWWRVAAGWHDCLERSVFLVRLLSGGEEAVHIADNADPSALGRLSYGCWVRHGFVFGLVLAGFMSSLTCSPRLVFPNN